MAHKEGSDAGSAVAKATEKYSESEASGADTNWNSVLWFSVRDEAGLNISGVIFTSIQCSE